MAATATAISPALGPFGPAAPLPFAPPAVDGFVLLDAQDWMTPAQLTALWREIDRSGSVAARVICRTAGATSPVDRHLPEPLRQRWRRLDDLSDMLFKQDRAAVYGGFHVYARAVH
jgi:S-adenosylmethionine-diacylglycerol 3-amino-3-carboxypropyl transferase